MGRLTLTVHPTRRINMKDDESHTLTTEPLFNRLGELGIRLQKLGNEFSVCIAGVIKHA